MRTYCRPRQNDIRRRKMLIKKIKEERLIFDNEKEALDRYEEIDNSTDCVENRISKNFSFEFDKWVYTITYKTIKYSDNSLKEGRD